MAMLFTMEKVYMSDNRIIKMINTGLIKHWVLFNILLVFGLTHSNVLYVSKTGSDTNNGNSKTSSWLTIEKAVESVVAGDTVYIRQGIYKEYLTIKTSGTSTNRITFTAYPGENSVIDGSDRLSNPTDPWNGDDYLLRIYGDYVTLRKLEFQNSAAFGVYVRADYAIIDSVYVHNGYLSGIYFYKCSHGIVTNCRVHDVYDYDEGGTGGGGNADCIGSSAGNDPTTPYGYHTFSGNLMCNCSDDGLDTWTSQNNIIENNVAYHTGYSNASNGGSASNNEPTGNGNGFKVGPGKNNIVRMNVTYDNSKRGFTVNDGDSIKMYNNTAFNTGSGFSVYTTGNIIKNNLCFGSSVYITDTLNERNNSWNLGIDDPEFASIDSSSPLFLHLAQGSPAIDAGVDVGLPFNGIAPDLGAYEILPVAISKPATHYLKPQFLSGNEKIKVYNLQGQIVWEGNFINEIRPIAFTPGTYFVAIQRGNVTAAVKLISR